MSELVASPEDSDAEEPATEEALAAGQAEEEAPKPPRIPPADVRINKLTAQFRQAERDNEALREELRQLRAEVKEPAKRTAPQEESLSRPRRKDYESAEEYAEAMADYAELRDLEIEQRWEEMRNWKTELSDNQKQQAQARQAEQQRQASNKILDAGRALVDDFDEVAAHADFGPEVMESLLEMDSKEAARLAYHLATHPDEVEELQGISPTRRAARMDRLASSVQLRARTKSAAPAHDIGGGESDSGRVTEADLAKAASGSAAEYQRLRRRWERQQA